MSHPDAKATPDRRRQILEAAEACFREEGFHGASMARIAARAGISVGHIYRYFENKEAVVADIVAQDLEATVLAISALPTTAEAQLATMLEVTRERAAPERMALWLEILAEAARNPRVAAMVRDADAQLRSRVIESLPPVESRPRDALDAEAQAELLCTLFEGALIRSLRTGSCEPLQARVLRDLMLWTLRGCEGTPGAPGEARGERRAPRGALAGG